MDHKVKRGLPPLSNKAAKLKAFYSLFLFFGVLVSFPIEKRGKVLDMECEFTLKIHIVAKITELSCLAAANVHNILYIG